MLYTDMSDIDYQYWLPACTLQWPGSQTSYASTRGEANQSTSVDADNKNEEVIDEELMAYIAQMMGKPFTSRELKGPYADNQWYTSKR